MARAYDAVVVGAGPAGLSAAAEITRAGGRCLVVEQGGAHGLRDRHAPEEIASGVGGAGLFSDGKHSFHPSATELWRLGDTASLARAYEHTRELLARHGVAAPPLPTLSSRSPSPSPARREPDGAWHLKRYPSVYVSLRERMRCVVDLHEACGDLPWLSARVVGARRTSSPHEGDLVELEVEQRGEPRRVEARHVIVATGRLSPRWIRPWLAPLGAAFAFRRLEIGVRLETSADAALFRLLEGVDPKLSLDLEGEGTRLLTFCTCRDGEVVVGSICNIHSVSGRADGPRTGRSSVGLLVRIVDASLARQIEPHVFAAPAPFRGIVASMVSGRYVAARIIAAAGRAPR